MARVRRLRVCSAISAASLVLTVAASAAAEPTEPTVLGWWTYVDNTKVATTSSSQHDITRYGDPNTYYYEPSGGHGLQDDPAVLPRDQAWRSIIGYVLAKSSGTLSSTFTVNGTSDITALRQAYYAYGLALVYVPKGRICDTYRVHIGSADDGVEVLINGSIAGYAYLGEVDKYVDLSALRPGVNEVLLIHEDQGKDSRKTDRIWIERNGTQIPVAPKGIVVGRTSEATTAVRIHGGSVSDTFLSDPLGFYFFAGLGNGTYSLTANHAGNRPATDTATIALGAASTEVVVKDIALATGCVCPAGQVCSASGVCSTPCIQQGDRMATCADPAQTCVEGACVVDACDTLTCNSGFVCQAGACVDQACSNICCASGKVCSAGACVTDNCGSRCPAGQSCAGGTCVDSCSLLTCTTPLVCVAGKCQEPAPTPAPDGGPGIDAGSTTPPPRDTDASAAVEPAPAGNPSEGCGCRIPQQASGSLGALVAGVVALLMAVRRRR